VTNVTDGFRANLSNLAPGPHALTAHLVVLRGLDDGLSMGIQSDWTATDKNGNRLLPSTTGNAVVLRAPRFTLDMNASAVRVNTTSRFILTLTIRNTGHALGIGWLNTTLPSGPTFVSDNGSFPRTKVSRRYTWTLPAVSPGDAIVLGIALDSAQNPGTASFVFTLDFTDGKGSAPLRVSGPRIDVEFVEPPTGPSSPGPADWLPWVIAVAAAGGLAAFVLWRRRRASDLQIEDVFVADMAGHLLAHRSSGLVAYEDEDILIGMFKVIQDFVKDSFAKGTDDTMKSMEFGERKIIIERGRYHFISVVYRGLDHGALSERVKKVSRLIDQKFGQALENWSGDLDELRGLATLLPEVWKHRTRRGTPRQPSAPSEAGSPSPGVTTGTKEGSPTESRDAGVAIETPK
jgi:MYXO-CTERM domain-containing protein